MQRAEHFATPLSGALGKSFQRRNDLGEPFNLRWGRIEFSVALGQQANVKVRLLVFREHDVRETYLIDTDPYDVEWNRHKRRTRDFFILPLSSQFGPVSSVWFSFIVHKDAHSIASENAYLLVQGAQLQQASEQYWEINLGQAAPNTYRTYELEAGQLQRDVDWYNQHLESLNVIPKFTKGQKHHPYHPKRFLHDHIDKVIERKRNNPQRLCTIKVSVDCIDDEDFIRHLIHASQQGVFVQCIVEWRKMTLTHSANYARLKQAKVELIGVVCTPQHPLIEVDPDMHTKFVIFDDEDCILGSFNITFDRWWANWESGMTFHSKGICRLLDNIFQSQRGGFIQGYGVDPMSRFNLLYTFGRQYLSNGKVYRPHHAILTEIHRARHSVRLVLFLMGELLGEHQDSVVDALLNAHHRGVDVRILFNGHLAREGAVGVERSMPEELARPLLPAIERLKKGGIDVGLVYGQDDHPVPYSPIHSKYCVIDESIVLEGSFNWYNASVFSHDLVVVLNDRKVAEAYLHEFDQIKRLFRVY